MIFNEFHYFSEVLRVQTTSYILLPEPAVMERHHNAPVPVLYLLHGLSDDHTNWMRSTRIEQYASRYYLAVVMPAVQRTFYTDMVYGGRYFTYVSQELPDAVERYFPVSKAREGRFAAGLSMGGYGAFKLGLRCPERYAAVASLSGVLTMQYAFDKRIAPYEMAEAVALFGDAQRLLDGPDNLYNLADKLVPTPEDAPKLFMCCGTEDSLNKDNEDFYAKYGRTFSIDYRTAPGVHSWDFWDAYIQQALAWMPLEMAENDQ